MAKRRKHWSEIVEAHGVKVRVYARAGTDHLWASVVRNGKKKRQSLKTSDRSTAKDRAKALARELAEMEFNGRPNEITFAKLRTLYMAKDGPNLSANRQKFMRTTLGLFTRFFEREGLELVADFGEHHARTYVRLRESGKLQSDDRRASDSPGAGTIRNELNALSRVCNWALTYRVNGRPVLGFNPVRGMVRRLKLQEKNPARPRASEDRYRKLLDVADRVGRDGAFRLWLRLAWGTGRRINAIVHLRVSDVLTTPQAITEAAARLGMPGEAEEYGRAWGSAILWRAEHDKVGHETMSAIPRELADELSVYIRRRGLIGDAWLFPRAGHEGEPMNKAQAGYRLKRAEQLAKLPKLERGGWHAFRRAWAHRRKHLPVQDVMEAGGWLDVKALQAAYQSSDPATVLRVMEAG